MNEIKKINERLLEESTESLEFGLKYYEEYCLSNQSPIVKQSILNLHKFIDCTLKYFVACVNPLLIFSKSFEKIDINIKSDHVISFEEALNFYINNLEYGLIETTKEYEKQEFKRILSSLKKLRNQITHWYIYPDELTDELNGIHDKISGILKLIYLICLNIETKEKIVARLSDEAKEILGSILEKEDLKLDLATQKVKKYVSNRTSPIPKEFNDINAPVLECPNCNKKTFILSSDNTFFECTYCEEKEEAGECHVNCCCETIKIPKSALNSFDNEWGTMICENCEQYILNKD